MDGVLIGLLSNMCYISGEIRWAETQTTANLKATCPISISVQGPVVTLVSRKWAVRIPVPKESGTQVKFETIKQIDFAATAGPEAPMSTIMLSSGKKGEFQLAIPGGFKGQSESERCTYRRPG